VFSGLAITGAATENTLSLCLEPATKLAAGGDVTDKELPAARQVCAHLQQSGLDRKTRRKFDHATSTLSDEQECPAGLTSLNADPLVLPGWTDHIGKLAKKSVGSA
jgi:hypothetical protein